MCCVYLSVEMQLGRFDCWVTKEQSRDQEVVPGAQQLLVLQQSFFIASQDLEWRECTWEMPGVKVTLRTGDKNGDWLCRWLPGVCCWKRSYPAGSDPPPRARGSTSHENLSMSVHRQAEERQHNVWMSKVTLVLQSAPRILHMLPLCYTDTITGLYTISKLSYLGFFIQNKGSTFWTNQQIQFQKQILSAAKMDK